MESEIAHVDYLMRIVVGVMGGLMLVGIKTLFTMWKNQGIQDSKLEALTEIAKKQDLSGDKLQAATDSLRSTLGVVDEQLRNTAETNSRHAKMHGEHYSHSGTTKIHQEAMPADLVDEKLKSVHARLESLEQES